MVERIRTLLESHQLTPTQFADLIGVARPIVSHILSGRNKPSLEVVQRILAAMPDLAMPWLLNGSGPMLATIKVGPVGAVPVPVSSLPPVPAISPTASASQSFVQQSENQQDKINNPTTVPQQAADALNGGRDNRANRYPDRVSRPTSKPAATPKRFVAKPLATNGPDEVENHQIADTLPEPTTMSTAPENTTAELAEVPLLATTISEAVSPRLAGAEVETSGTAAESAMTSALFAGTEKPIRRIVIFYRDGSFADYQPE